MSTTRFNAIMLSIIFVFVMAILCFYLKITIGAYNYLRLRSLWQFSHHQQYERILHGGGGARLKWCCCHLHDSKKQREDYLSGAPPFFGGKCPRKCLGNNSTVHNLSKLCRRRLTLVAPPEMLRRVPHPPSVRGMLMIAHFWSAILPPIYY